MPLSMRRRDRRRAPATDAAIVYAHTTNDRRRRNEPSVAMDQPFEAGDGSAAWYFDGHFAMTPFGSTAKPSGPRRPFNTTSEPFLNVSGTTPVYRTGTTFPLL